MRIALASDHAGYPLKVEVAKHLEGAGHEVVDLGTDSEAPVDYPPFCASAARAVVRGEAKLGVVMGGSGQGEQISANKVHGARAALCHDEFTARLARQHNDANVLSMGARVLGVELALTILDVFVTTGFEGGRHVPRLAEISAIEAEECGRRRPDWERGYKRSMGFFLAVMAALCNAIASVLQRRGASTAPDTSVLRVKLMTYVIRRPVWLFGFLTMVGAFLFQAAALSYGQLSTVQPVLVTELLFVLFILSIWSRSRPGREEWIGAVAVSGGLAGFLLAASPAGGSTSATAGDWGVAGLGTGVVVGVLIALALRSAPFGRAALFGSAAAITFALNAAFIKASTDLIGRGTLHFFASWPPYAVAVTGLGAFFIVTNAFQSGPLTATQPALTVVDPMASIIIGAEVFGESLRDSPGWVAVECVTLVIMAVGVILLSRGPLVSTEMGDATAGRAKDPAATTQPLSSHDQSAVRPSGWSG